MWRIFDLLIIVNQCGILKDQLGKRVGNLKYWIKVSNEITKSSDIWPVVIIYNVSVASLYFCIKSNLSHRQSDFI